MDDTGSSAPDGLVAITFAAGWLKLAGRNPHQHRLSRKLGLVVSHILGHWQRPWISSRNDSG